MQVDFMFIIPFFQIFEKVLVQNIQFGLSPSFTDALQTIPRWRFIMACMPHVMQCAAAMLQHRYVRADTITTLPLVKDNSNSAFGTLTLSLQCHRARSAMDIDPNLFLKLLNCESGNGRSNEQMIVRYRPSITAMF